VQPHNARPIADADEDVMLGLGCGRWACEPGERKRPPYWGDLSLSRSPGATAGNLLLELSTLSTFICCVGFSAQPVL
jgi:hypothetical protein